MQLYKGRLGRTTKTSVLISSASGPVFPASVYTGVNVTEDPELADAILSGELNRVDCPFDDGRTYTLAVPVRYHDEGHRVFALLIPESLRHEEFKHRSELLQELAKERDVLPDYVRHFKTVFDPSQLATLHASEAPAAPAPEPEEATQLIDLAELDRKEAAAAEAKAELSAERDALAKQRAELEELRAELDASKGELESSKDALAKERTELDVSRQQLGQVSDRLERERARMDELEMNLVADREELEAARIDLATKRAAIESERSSIETERAQVEAMKLNLEEQRHRQETGDAEIPQEATQVVTDDQFIEVLSEDVAPAEAPEQDDASALAHSEATLEGDVDDDDFSDGATQITQLPKLGSIHPPKTFDRSKAGGNDRHIKALPEGVLASCVATSKKVGDVIDADAHMMLQFSEIEGYPLPTLLLGTLDDEQQLARWFAWPLDPARAEDAAVLERLAESTAVRFAFYNSKGKLLRTWDAIAPLESNARTIAKRARAALDSGTKGTFGRAVKAYLAHDFERLGSMRHTFSSESFTELDLVSTTKLAAGIVGYWSTPDVHDYLILNRSFPLVTFEAIQRRVSRAALGAGLYINGALREAAVRLGEVSDESDLTRRLLANFAELSVGLREHDLDPLDEWENWDALLSLADEVGVRPDEEVVELAQASLRRAQEFQEGPMSEPLEEELVDDEIVEELDDADLVEEEASEPPNMPPAPTLPPSDSFDSLVVSKRSESTGVTYFLPDDAVLDQFEDMSQMPKDDLLMLLDDANGRLEAAQMLIERFGAPVVRPVLEKSEEMMASEIAALSRFLESRADGIEGELVRCVESGGPSATYIASHALVTIKSASAAPTLIEALRDPKRQGNTEQLARTLAGLGDKLTAPLTRVIKKDGHDDALVSLIVALDKERSGTIARLAKDRHRKVREAAREAKKRT